MFHKKRHLFQLSTYSKQCLMWVCILLTWIFKCARSTLQMGASSLLSPPPQRPPVVHLSLSNLRSSQNMSTCRALSVQGVAGLGVAVRHCARARTNHQRCWAFNRTHAGLTKWTFVKMSVVWSFIKIQSSFRKADRNSVRQSCET